MVVFVEKQNKRALLEHILKNKDIETALVFTRTKHGADKVVKIYTVPALVQRPYMAINRKMQGNALSNFKIALPGF